MGAVEPLDRGIAAPAETQGLSLRGARDIVRLGCDEPFFRRPGAKDFHGLGEARRIGLDRGLDAVEAPLPPGVNGAPVEPPDPRSTSRAQTASSTASAVSAVVTTRSARFAPILLNSWRHRSQVRLPGVARSSLNSLRELACSREQSTRSACFRQVERKFSTIGRPGNSTEFDGQHARRAVERAVKRKGRFGGSTTESARFPGEGVQFGSRRDGASYSLAGSAAG